MVTYQTVSRGPPEIKCLLGKHERAVFVVGRRLSRSLLNVKLSHAPVGLSITQSVGMPLKVFTERHNVLKQTY